MCLSMCNFFSSVLFNISIISRTLPTLRLEYQHRCALDADCLFGRSALLLLLLLSIFMFFHQHLLNNNNRLLRRESMHRNGWDENGMQKDKKKQRGGKKEETATFLLSHFPFTALSHRNTVELLLLVFLLFSAQ